MRSRDHVESHSGDVFLERIPESIYEDLVGELTRRYGFVNGSSTSGTLHFAEYYLGLRRSAADALGQCVQEMLEGAQMKKFPTLPLPDGFHACAESLPTFDREGGIPFGYFDAAVTAEGLRIIEAQSNVTYAVTGAFAGSFLQNALSLSGSSVFVHDPKAEWQDLIDLKRDLVAGDETEGVVIADRELLQQKTKFEHYANQRELDANIDVIDTRWVTEGSGGLWYRTHEGDSLPKRVRRIYHRTLAMEAIEEDHYPQNTDHWKFRFDRAYEGVVHVNHPGKNFEISKHILPYVSHPFNPPCWELSDLAEAYRRGDIGDAELVWKHKLGVAGRGLFLLPNNNILTRLTETEQLGEYIAQRKVNFERFETGDGQEKIVELRFMTTQSADQLLVVPMARIGHVRKSSAGQVTYHIHFSENNKPGYGFCPVLIVDE